MRSNALWVCWEFAGRPNSRLIQFFKVSDQFKTSANAVNPSEIKAGKIA
jgi:hypothetical protein